MRDLSRSIGKAHLDRVVTPREEAEAATWFRAATVDLFVCYLRPRVGTSLTRAKSA